MLNSEYREAVREHIGTIPEHVQAWASAIRYDLRHGPAWARIPALGVQAFTVDDFASFPDDLELGEGDTLEEVYVGQIAEALRDYINALPSRLYVDDSGYASEHEPEGEYIDADGEPCDSDAEDATYCEPEPYATIGSRGIIEALFGSDIAHNFPHFS